MKKNRVGEKFVTNEGYKAEIIEYFGRANCTILFEDGLILHKIDHNNIAKGMVSNPHHKSVYNTGYFGVGKYKSSINSKFTKEYLVWKSMLQRCYDINYHIKKPTYIGCVVCEEWLNFQNFSKWFEENYIEGFELDKDILFENNKIYSPTTCCFVPKEINISLKTNGTVRNLPKGVEINNKKFAAYINKKYLGSFETPEEASSIYKKYKEEHIKEIAEKWKSKIPEKVYQSIINYKIQL